MGLTVLWTDHRGKEWNLTTGAQGVILDLGQEGLGVLGLSHTFVRGDQVHAAATVKSRPLHFKVLVGWNKTGQEYYSLASEWWTQANSPFREGTLTVISPNGTRRSRRLRHYEDPDTSYLFDPGLGQENGAELWSLRGNYGWWYGEEQVKTFTMADFTGGQGTPFYGDDGVAWPFYISSGTSANDVFLDNTGAGPMWITWTLVGPLTNPRFGVTDGGVLGYNGTIPAGEVVTVITNPEGRSAYEVSTFDNRFPYISGQWAPVPLGTRIPLTLVAEGMSASSQIKATAASTHTMPF